MNNICYIWQYEKQYLQYQQFQLKYQQMNKIYDIDSDQLKCSFCTNYFKCSIHYANIQRYSLKACNKCLSNFNYTVLHPQTYQLFKVLLFDIGINIPLENGKVQLKTETQALKLQIIEAKEDINNKITKHFEDKINDIIKEMTGIKDIIAQSFTDLQKLYAEIMDFNNPTVKIGQVRKKIEEIRDYQINVIDQGGRQININVLDENNKYLNHSQNKLKDLSLKSSKKQSFQQSQKQNLSQNRSNAAKLIKSKCGLQSSYRILTSRSKSKLLDKSRISKSIIKSIKLDGSSSRLDQSVNFVHKYEQRERSQVTKLLEHKHTFVSYMPCQVTKQSNVCLKSEGNRNLVESVLQLKNKTVLNDMLIELIGGDSSKTNFPCYLQTLKDLKQIKTVRMIRCSLVDADMDHILNFLSENSLVQTLIVTNNRLTELSIEALLSFKERHPNSCLSNVYLGNNYISNLKASTIIKRQNTNGLSFHL